ncbi:hypothetical protein [Mammaliicoccus vitulinus]|uniref:hypothetical protein n=1 Tax=Mammaliicoccus vitulinus TaxID=71237 RepID=UPI00248C7656|nr:hypothetical protein [Mammaliicoccus vitulinus]
MARCLLLSQENTPEARLTIIKELTKLKESNEDLAAKIKAVIDDEVQKNKEIQNAKKKAIEELNESNDNLMHEMEQKSNPSTNAKGRI